MVGDEVSAVEKATIMEDLVDHEKSTDLFPKCQEKPLNHHCCVDCRRDKR